MDNRPVTRSDQISREFACFPAAVLGFVIDRHKRLLMLSHPEEPVRWEVISGALEHGETVVDGTLREITEEAGPGLDLTPLGCFHVESFTLTDDLPPLISVHYLFACNGGEAIPGSDMANCRAAWFTEAEILALGESIVIPRFQPWLFTRAFRCFTDWRDDTPQLQKP